MGNISRGERHKNEKVLLTRSNFETFQIPVLKRETNSIERGALYFLNAPRTQRCHYFDKLNSEYSSAKTISRGQSLLTYLLTRKVSSLRWKISIKNLDTYPKMMKDKKLPSEWRKEASWRDSNSKERKMEDRIIGDDSRNWQITAYKRIISRDRILSSAAYILFNSVAPIINRYPSLLPAITSLISVYA